MTAINTEVRSFERSIGGFFNLLEVDVRMVSMVLVLALIWIGFQIMTGGNFITPRNLWNLAVQTSVVGIMATGMVFMLIMRNVDLSIGSILGFSGMLMAIIQVEWLPPYLGLGHPLLWIAAVLLGIIAATLIGMFQGVICAYGAVPSFIVTLGGLLVFRGAAWWVASGRTVAPMDETFQMIGGGITGSIGAAASWIFAAVVAVLITINAYRARLRRKHFGFPLKPLWAEFLVTGIAVAAIIGFVAVMNAYPLPVTVAEDIWKERGVELAEGSPVPPIARGIPIPVLIMLAVAAAMAFLARRTRFGRHVYAIGGNPEAAKLGGIHVKRMTVATFALMGLVTGIAAAIATARLNAGANATGTLAELTTIAAAVIGGTSLGGGVGTVVGALLGALVMQSLSSGMVLVGIDTPMQNIVIGVVLVTAVWLDTMYQRLKR
jgi:D-xylose transport system permease protein